MPSPIDANNPIETPRSNDRSLRELETAKTSAGVPGQWNLVELCRDTNAAQARYPLSDSKAIIENGTAVGTDKRSASGPHASSSDNPSGQTSVWSSLAPLKEARELEQHLRTHRNAKGQIEYSVQPESVAADGSKTIIMHTPESLVRTIKREYLEALKTAADSEPARQRDMAKIDQTIDKLKKSMELERTPSFKDLDAMLAPANQGRLSPDQRTALEVMQQQLTLRQELLNSGSQHIQAHYELFLEKTGQTSALQNFRRDKQLLETLPFQNWLSRSEKSLGRQIISGQLSLREDENPLVAHQAALASLERNPPDRDGAERSFRTAVSLAGKIDSRKIDEELIRLKVLKEKTDPNSTDHQYLKHEEKTLVILKASPGLMKMAYADFLLNSGDKAAAFQQLMAAADNPAAVAMVNKSNNYFEQLVDRSTYGNKNTTAQLTQAASDIKESEGHFVRALQLSKSDKPEDKIKAEKEFEEAREIAKKVREESKNVDAREMSKNIQLFEAAIRAERAKPADQQNQDKLKVLDEQRANYAYLAHVPSLAGLNLAKDEYALAVQGGNQPTAEQATAIRALTDWVKGDPKLGDIAGASGQLDALAEIVRQRSYGEAALNWLRQNSGSLVALGVGFTVAGLTCWSGPGAALAGAAAAGAVAGTCADWACGNEVSLESFGGNALSASGGGVGKLLGTKLAAGALSRSPWLVRSVATGAATSGSSSAIENIPIVFYEGPLPYLGKVSFDTVFGAVAHGPKSKIADVVPAVRSPIFSRSVKAGATGFSPD